MLHRLTSLLSVVLWLLCPFCLVQAASQQVSQDPSLLGSDDYVRSFVSRKDGTVIVAAVSTEGAHGISLLLLSYTPNGKVDHTFGTDGKVRVDFIVEVLLLLPDSDKLLAVGQHHNRAPLTNQSTLKIAQYNADGSLDTTFGADGVVTTALPLEPTITVRAVAIDNKIVVVGQLSSPRGNVFLLRYHSNGQNDAGFGENGKVTGVFEVSAAPLAVHALQNGGLMLAGAAPTGVNNTPVGEPIVTFGTMFLVT